jgi:pimeloyl-ACP methyl ester carboxylesterase
MPIELHRIEEGTGRPVIALHGVATNLFSWRYLAAPLAKTHRVIRFDLKGHGRSPRPRDGRYSGADNAALILDFIRRNDLKDIVLAGHSYGGEVALMVALQLLREEKRRLAALVLCAPAALPQDLPLFVRALNLPLVGAFSFGLVPPRTLARAGLLLNYAVKTRIPKDAIEAYAAGLRPPGSAYALTQTVRQIVPENVVALTAELATIDVPTLLLWGERDRLIPFASARRLHAMIRNSELIHYADCGHLPHEEKHEVAIPAILDFVARVQKA